MSGFRWRQRSAATRHCRTSDAPSRAGLNRVDAVLRDLFPVRQNDGLGFDGVARFPELVNPGGKAKASEFIKGI